MPIARRPLSEYPEPPWSSKRAPSKSDDRAPLTRDSIIDAALAIVDAEGLEELSMRRLAEALDAPVSALYLHVASKAELLQLLLDRVASAVEIPAPIPDLWEEQLRQVARSMRASLAAHRDLVAATFGSVPTGPNAVGVLNKLLALLLAAGLPRQIAAYTADLIRQYVSASLYEAHLLEQRLARDPAHFHELDAYLRSFPRGRYVAVTEVIGELTSPDVSRDARFEFGLDMLVRGLATYANPRSKPGRPLTERPGPPPPRQRQIGRR